MNDSVFLTFLLNSDTVLLSFSIASHLLTAIIIPRPLSWAIPAIFASCSVIPSVASITRTTTSALSTAETVRSIEYLSISSFILFFLLRPAVSINTYSLPFHFTAVSTASLVVPATSDTITLFSPRSLFIIDDFPAFGLPTIAILGLSSSASSSFSGKRAVTSSSISPIPNLPIDDIGYGSPSPKL